MANQSGISEIPSLLPYPSMLKLEEFDGLQDMFCYVIEHFGNTGISYLVSRNPKQDQVIVQFGDWRGNVYDLEDSSNSYAELCRSFFDEYGKNLIYFMKLCNIDQAIYYITINTNRRFILADVRTALNKFLGPGMLRDVFGSIIETPTVLTTEHMTRDTLDALRQGKGKYSGDLVLKPSRFRVVKWNGVPNPLYVEVVR